LIDAGAPRVVVEVKYTSPNDVQVPSSRFDRYLNRRCFSDAHVANTTGLYELIRNWMFGCELAETRQPHSRQATPSGTERTSLYASCLTPNPDQGFVLLGWGELLAILNSALSPVLQTYLSGPFP
jgi:hypothetical protein